MKASSASLALWFQLGVTRGVTGSRTEVRALIPWLLRVGCGLAAPSSGTYSHSSSGWPFPHVFSPHSGGHCSCSALRSASG